MTDHSRADFIIEVLTREFGDPMAQDPAAFRRKFRKMAASPFAFYRGSASLFYADQIGAYSDNSFLDERTSRVWIHGDLHAANFGTYMTRPGSWCSTSTTSTRRTSARSPGTSNGSPPAWP